MKSFFLFEVEDTTTAAVDIEIPGASEAGEGAEILVRDKSDGTNPVTVTPATGTIDGESTATVSGLIRLLSDGVQWMDVGGGGSSDSLEGEIVTIFGTTIGSGKGVIIKAGDPDTGPRIDLGSRGGAGANGVFVDSPGRITLQAADRVSLTAGTNLNFSAQTTASLTAPEGATFDSSGPDEETGGVVTVKTSSTTPGKVNLQVDPAQLLAAYGGDGAAQMAHVPVATDDGTTLTLVNAIRTWLLAAGFMAPAP